MLLDGNGVREMSPDQNIRMGLINPWWSVVWGGWVGLAVYFDSHPIHFMDAGLVSNEGI